MAFLGMLSVVCLAVLFALVLQLSGMQFLDLWLTPDQQGRFYFERGMYGKAAGAFRDLRWRAAAHYAAGQFRLGELLYARIEDADGYFNYGNALAQQRKYVTALVAYERALSLDPRHEDASHNHGIIQKLVAEIEQTTESQHKGLEPDPEPSSSVDVEEASGEKAAGLSESVGQTGSAERLTADELIRDRELYEIWMRVVRHDPADFLRAKLQMNSVQEKAE